MQPKRNRRVRSTDGLGININNTKSMAWNPSPKIQDLREIAPKWGYDQMIVLAINSKTGTFETVSYGVTRQLCDEARKINEQIHAKVASGDIEIDA